MHQETDLKRRFQELYGTAANVYRAPGRVNLIGEHTDYNDGFVLPAALGFSTQAAIAPRADRRLIVRSGNLGESMEFDLDEVAPQPHGHWSDYVRGVAVMLENAGHRLRGAGLLIHSDIPIGAGLSSSAAIEVATGLALLGCAGKEIDRVELAKLCRRAENEFAGIGCGIMDQFVSCCGQPGQALLLDCRSLEYRLAPLPADARLVICNSMVKHKLAGGDYNRRREECETGVKLLASALPGVRALRDVSLAQLQERSRALPEVIYRRCYHVVSENERVQVAVSMLERGELATFGQLMKDSHRSLRDDYEVSCAELDLLVRLAERLEGVYGSRMTGGGFGGCTVNLVRADRVQAVAQSIAADYERATGRTPEIYICETSEDAANAATVANR